MLKDVELEKTLRIIVVSQFVDLVVYFQMLVGLVSYQACEFQVVVHISYIVIVVSPF